MHIVNVKKAALLEKLHANREAHRSEFLKACGGFRREAVKLLDQMLDQAKSGKEFEFRWGLPKPQEHTVDYDRAIAMLEMSVDDVIELDESQFAQLVMDDWGWKQAFQTTNSTYITR